MNTPTENQTIELANVSTLLELAEPLTDDFEDDTLFYLANALFVSLERFESALRADDAPSREQVYGLAYDSYHLANALTRLLIPDTDDFLSALLNQLQKIAETHAPDFVGVSA